MKNSRCLIAFTVLLIGAGMNQFPLRPTQPDTRWMEPATTPPGTPETRPRLLLALGDSGHKTRIFKKTAQVALLMGSFFVLYLLLQPSRIR